MLLWVPLIREKLTLHGSIPRALETEGRLVYYVLKRNSLVYRYFGKVIHKSTHDPY